MRHILNTNRIKYFFYGVCVFCYALLQSQFSNIIPKFSQIIQIIMIFSLIIMSLISFNKKTSVNVIVLCKILFIICLFIWIFFSGQKEKEIILILLAMILCSNLNYKKVLETYSISVFISLCIVILTSFMHLLPNNIDALGRYSLGFKFTTFSANLFFSAVIAYVSSKGTKITLTSLLLILFINIFLYLKTNTSAVFFEIILFLIGYLFIVRKNIKSNLTLKKIVPMIPIILALFTISFQIYYNNNSSIFLDKIDLLLSNRLYLGKKAFSLYDITLFGQPVEWSNKANGSYFYVDSSYINVLFSYGLVTLSVVCLVFKKMLRCCLDSNDILTVWAMIIFLIHAITDPQMLSFRNNPFIILYIGMCIKNIKDKKEEVLK